MWVAPVRRGYTATVPAISLTLFSWLMSVVALSSLPEIGVHSANSSSLNISSNSLAVSAPRTPPGFEVDLDYGTFNINPLAVFLAAIDCMAEFAGRGWDQVFTTGLRVWATGYPVQIILDSSHGPHGPLPLRAGHAILALYETITSMSANERFSEATASMYLQRREIGSLKVRRLTTLTHFNGPLEVPFVAIPANRSSVGAGPSGSVIDADDPKFTVFYEYSGTRINSKDIFLAVLDAMAITGEHDAISPFRSLRASSTAYKCEITITEAAIEHQINYRFVLKALWILVWDVFMQHKIFGELSFQLKYESSIMGEGSIKAVSSSSKSTSGTDVAR